MKPKVAVQKIVTLSSVVALKRKVHAHRIIIIRRAGIIVACVILLKVGEHFAKLYIAHTGIELAVGSAVDHLMFWDHEDVEVVEDVAEDVGHEL